jgi:4-amino-4-deoxy-L-arabinose transferase-like glycosyltransferase
MIVATITKRQLILLGIIFFLGLWLRAHHVHGSHISEPYKADAGEYMTCAVNLYQHGIYSSDRENTPPIPDSFRSPGYPVFLVGVRVAVGEFNFYDAVRALQAVLGALMVPLTYLLARRFLSVALAMIAAALVATNPHLITITGYVLTETLYGFLLLLALVLFYGGTKPKFAGAGACFGLATLTNGTALVIPPVLAVAWLLWGRGPSRLRAAVLFLAVFAVLPLAWKVRGAVSIPPEGRQAGERALATMAHGSYPGFVHEDPKWKYYPYRDDPQYREFVRSRENFLRILGERFAERPGRYLSWYLLEKPFHLYGWSYLQGYSDIHIEKTEDPIFRTVPVTRVLYWAHLVLHPALTLLLPVALLLWLWRRKKFDLLETPGPLLLVFLIYTLIGTVFAPWPRYLVPLKPLLFAASLWPVALAFGRWRTRRTA